MKSRTALLLLLASAGCGTRALPPRTAPAPTHESDDSAAAPDRTVATPTSPPVAELPFDDSGESDSDEGAEGSPDEEETASPGPSAPIPHPLDGWSDERIERAVTHDLAALGSMSVGTPNAGGLVNGVQAVASPLYSLVSPGSAWGTQETIDYLNSAIEAVHAEFPETPPLALGDIGVKHGGPLRPHISHQAGRDLDISFYYREKAPWYSRGTRENLDFPRLWAFVRALVVKTDIDLILLDHGLQEPLQEYALSIGEDPAWVDGLFKGKAGQRALILHAPGHATHLHLRFWNPIAQETARRCFALLARHQLVKVPERYLSHKAKKNETLGMLARKYGSSVRAIREANGLRSNLIHDQVVYRIPVTGGGVRLPRPERLRVPARRLPPPRRAGRPEFTETSRAESTSPPLTR